jgi:hypothetical protein
LFYIIFQKYKEEAVIRREKYYLDLKEWETKMLAKGRVDLVRRCTFDEMDKVKKKTAALLREKERANSKLTRSMKHSSLYSIAWRKWYSNKKGRKATTSTLQFKDLVLI